MGRPSAHFCGIGGTGMVAGARLAVEAGWEVRGSDNPLYPPSSDMVAALGVPAYTQGYDAAHLDWNPDLVVIGNALSRGNPEVERVLSDRMRYVSLPEWLKENVLRPRRPVAVCGTHGKTTTTALLAYLLDRAGRRPGYLVGGQPLDFEHSARLGEVGTPFVVEGDEYDTAFFDKRAKFFHYVPDMAVVTSIEFDHGDIYPDLAAIERAFQLMLRQIPQDGRLFVCADDAGSMALLEAAFCPVVTYGFADGADWRGVWRRESDGARPGCCRLEVYRRDALWAELDAPLAGIHNLRNTLAAVAVAEAHGVSPEAVAEALPRFKGVKRRMEVFLETPEAVFIDDFAHHPTAIRETLRAARERWPGRRVRALFEPRSNTTVTRRFQEPLTQALAEADEVWIGPIHRADKIPEAERLDREQLAGDLRAAGKGAYAADVEAIAAGVVNTLAPGDVVVVCSNGAFGGLYGMLRATLAPGAS